MGRPGSVSRLVWHVKRDRKLEKSVNELEDLSQCADPTDLRLFLDCAGHVGAVHPNDRFHLLETPVPNLVAGMKWVLGGEGVPVVLVRPGRESRCGLFGSAGEEARAQMKAMMEKFRATETAMLLSELKVNVCYLGLLPETRSRPAIFHEVLRRAENDRIQLFP